MEEFEKVEKLKERANVSYEDAKAALSEANGDILDAMILLERQGKTGTEDSQTHSTTYEDQRNYVNVADTVENQNRENEKTIGQKLRHLLSLICNKIRQNDFVVVKEGKEIVKVPLWALLIALILGFWFVVVILIIGLFLSCRYSVVGPEDTSVINDVMGKASDVADKVKDEFDKL